MPLVAGEFERVWDSSVALKSHWPQRLEAGSSVVLGGRPWTTWVSMGSPRSAVLWGFGCFRFEG